MPETIELLKQGFRVAVRAAQAEHALPPCLPSPPKGRTVVIGFGKAGAAMAQSVEQHWQGNKDKLTGIVVVPYGSALPTTHIKIIEAAHPVPDNNSHIAAQQLLSAVKGLTADDLVICLISGGGSALLSMPPDGLSLQTKQYINQQLLHSGARIDEINCIRKHLSAIKGGRLAAACYPASVVNFIISDVPGDAPTSIASGPTVADPSTCHDALTILDHYGISIDVALRYALQSAQWESIKPDDSRLKTVQTHLIATPKLALDAAVPIFASHGYSTLLLGDALEGEAKEIAVIMAGISKSILTHQQPVTAPCVLLSGGEASVQVKGDGCGGRNVEFLLALLVYLRDNPRIYALAADTDGVDGAAQIAGAYIDPNTWTKAKELGLDPVDFLKRQDAHTFFQLLNQQIITGPTHTNVNDFRAVLITQ